MLAGMVLTPRITRALSLHLVGAVSPQVSVVAAGYGPDRCLPFAAAGFVLQALVILASRVRCLPYLADTGSRMIREW